MPPPAKWLLNCRCCDTGGATEREGGVWAPAIRFYAKYLSAMALIIYYWGDFICLQYVSHVPAPHSHVIITAAEYSVTLVFDLVSQSWNTHFLRRPNTAPVLFTWGCVFSLMFAYSVGGVLRFQKGSTFSWTSLWKLQERATVWESKLCRWDTFSWRCW